VGGDGTCLYGLKNDQKESSLVHPYQKESSDGGPTQSLHFSSESCNSKDFSIIPQTSKQAGLQRV